MKHRKALEIDDMGRQGGNRGQRKKSNNGGRKKSESTPGERRKFEGGRLNSAKNANLRKRPIEKGMETICPISLEGTHTIINRRAGGKT